MESPPNAKTLLRRRLEALNDFPADGSTLLLYADWHVVARTKTTVTWRCKASLVNPLTEEPGLFTASAEFEMEGDRHPDEDCDAFRILAVHALRQCERMIERCQRHLG